MFRHSVIALLVFLFSPVAFAAGGGLFLPVDAAQGAQAGAAPAALSMPQGARLVRINPAFAQGVQPGQRVALGAITGSPRDVVFSSVKKNARGAKVWVGEVADVGDDFRIILVQDDQATVGRILTPEGEFLLRSEQGQTVLVDVKAAGLRVPPVFCGTPSLRHPAQDHDHLARPSANAENKASLELASSMSSAPATIQSGASSPAVAGTTIDVLVVVNNDLATTLGSGLNARIDFLFALTNQAYIDSGVDLEIRRVGQIVQLNYSSLNDNGIALDAITDGVAPFNTMGSLRDAAGADLVVFIRPFQYPEQVSCGVAWVSGYNQQPIGSNLAYWSANGYAVVSDGSDPSGYYCTDTTFPHELGHNMGLAHDRANGGGIGAYTYANGYGIDGVFGTVMSYLSPEVSKFSNPNRTCTGGNPCGVSELAQDSAYAALALNNTKASIAAFRTAPAVSASCGTANNVASMITPTSLCASGTPSSVTSSTSLYSWSCVGSNTVQCSAPRHYSLTIGITGEGSVGVNPQQASYAYNTSVSLTAQPASGKVLSAWGGACSGSSTTCNVSMSSNRSVSATFVNAPIAGSCGAANGVTSIATPVSLCTSGTPSSVTSSNTLFSWSCAADTTAQCSAPRHYGLSLSVTGDGSIAVSPNQASYAYNTSVSLTAQPASGMMLAAWGGDCSGSSTTCNVSMSASRAVSATFVTPPPAAGCGAAAGVPSVATPTNLCTIGTASSVLSTNSLYSWSCVGSTTVQCNAPRHYSLSGTLSAGGNVQINPNQASYAYNSSVSLSATPEAGKVFGAWGGDCTGTSTSCILSMSSHRSYSASFSAPTENHFSRMYLAAFLRAADLGGMNYWSNQIVNEGQSYQRVGGTIFSLSVVTAIYPAGMADQTFVEAIYSNVFGRASDAGGLAYWTNELIALRNTYAAQGSGNAAFEARGQLVMNMINAGLGTVEGTPGKAYIDHRFQVALYAFERQRVLGKEIPPATLRSISDSVTADKATVAPAEAAIDAALI